MSGSVLDGLKVLEYGEFISVPYCGRMLAGMGAEVIKIEKPDRGDSSRSFGPFPRDEFHLEKSGLYLFLNAGKSSLTLDTSSPAGQDVFRQMVSQADVLIEGNPPREMTDRGLNYEGLSKVNSSLVMTSITPFGQTGPYRDYRGSDLITAHISGEAYGNPAEGVEDMEHEGPLKPPNHASDFMVGLTAAVCTMSAILGRQLNGEGQHLDVSAQEALASVVRQELAFYMHEGRAPTRQKGIKRRGGILYRSSDGFVCIWAGPHFSKLINMLGNPDWADTELFQDPVLRADHMEEFNILVNIWTEERTRAEIEQAAVVAGVPCAPVRSVAELCGDEQLAAREYFVEMNHQEAGLLRYPGAPFKLSETPWQVNRPAPLLGADNDRVYGEFGFNKQDLENLKKAGTI